MSYGNIAAVGEALTQYLRNEVSGGSGSAQGVRLISVPELAGGAGLILGVCLYDVGLSPSLRNVDRILDTDTVRQPSVYLDLRYLVVAFGAGADGQPEATAQHRLGEAIEALAELQRLESSTLGRVALEGADSLAVHLEHMGAEGMARIWSLAPNIDYRPSIPLLVSGVPVALTEERQVQRVTRREQAVEAEA